jgi:hypothetical protein
VDSRGKGDQCGDRPVYPRPLRLEEGFNLFLGEDVPDFSFPG